VSPPPPAAAAAAATRLLVLVLGAAFCNTARDLLVERYALAIPPASRPAIDAHAEIGRGAVGVCVNRGLLPAAALLLYRRCSLRSSSSELS
jgi:hypothetical protein